jgi:hypothetical protein
MRFIGSRFRLKLHGICLFVVFSTGTPIQGMSNELRVSTIFSMHGMHSRMNSINQVHGRKG